MSKLPIPPRRNSMFEPTPAQQAKTVHAEAAAIANEILDASFPPVGRGKMGFVAQRLPASLISKVDAYAEAQGISRSEAIRRILAAALPQ